MLRLLPIILFTLLVGMLGIALWSNPAHKPLPSTLLGTAFPQLDLPYLEGYEAQKPLQGVRLVNIFASWCVPCVAELPYLRMLKERYDLTIIGIGWKDSPEKLRRWLGDHPAVYDVVLVDPQGRITVPLGLTGVPETYVLDAQGVLRYRLAAPLTPESLSRDILPVLNMMMPNRAVQNN